MKNKLLSLINESDRYSICNQKILFAEFHAAEKNNLLGYFLKLSESKLKVKNSCNSYLAYILNITDECPKEFDIPIKFSFDAPDIDLDFPSGQREQVIEYVRQRYGHDKTAQLITFSTFAPRGLIQDSARVLGVPLWEVKQATSQVVERSSGDARAELCLLDSVKEYEKLKELYNKNPKMYKAIALEGQIKNIGKHAAGVVLGNCDLKTIGFINNHGVFSVDKYSIEKIGCLKIDVLAVEALDIVQDVCKKVGFDWNKMYNINLEDSFVYEKVFKPCKVIGIFQFEGLSVKQVCRSIRPYCFNHLVHVTALARPGSLNSRQTAKYIERFNGASYQIDDFIKPYTQDTLGILMFQEQVMAIVREIGNFNWDDTGKIRRAMSKNIGEEYVMTFMEKFVEGAKRLNIEKEKAEQLYKSISMFGCLSGNSVLRLPWSNQYSPKKITIKKLYENGGVAKIAVEKWNHYGQRNRRVLLFSMKENKILPERMVEIYKSGIKKTFLVKTISGKKIRATKEHKFYVKNEWRRLKEIKVGDEIAIIGNKFSSKKNKGIGSGAHNERHGQSKLYLERLKILQKKYKRCKLCCSGKYGETPHKDYDRKNNKWSNLIPICRKCHKSLHEKPKKYSRGYKVEYDKVIYIGDSKVEMTYDIAMPEPYHNYIANDFIVHNSWAFNKSHSVSYALLSYWMAYCKTYYPAQFYSRILKNEINEIKIKSILKEWEGKVIPCDINRSKTYFSVEKEIDGTEILVGGLTNIKGIGEKVAEKIIQARPYVSFEDFKKRMSKGIVKHIEVTPEWSDITSLQEQVKESLGKLKLSSSILSCEEVLTRGEDNNEYLILGKVIIVNPKDHNETEKVVKRGFKMNPPTEFVVLKIVDDSDNLYVLCFDRFYTVQHKQELLALKNKICLFKVIKKGEGMMLGKKFKELL